MEVHWIRVDDALPRVFRIPGIGQRKVNDGRWHSRPVLVWPRRDGHDPVATYSARDGFRICGFRPWVREGEDPTVTHWMPLPRRPDDEGR